MAGQMKRIVDGGYENCGENMKLAIQHYSDRIAEALTPLNKSDLPIVCVALKNVLAVVVDGMDEQELEIAAMFNEIVGCEGSLVKTGVKHEQDS